MKRHVDLLPQSHHRRAILRRRVAQWIVVLAATVIIAAGFVAIKHRQLAATLAWLGEVEGAHKPLVQMQGAIERMRVELEEVQRREAMALKLSDERPTLTALGIVSRAARQCEGNISVQQLTLAERQAERPGANEDGAPPLKILTLKGQGLDHLSVARFVASLREIGAFQRVELKSSGTEANSASTADTNRRYLIECTF